VEPLDDHPSEGTGRGAKMGNQRCHASLGTWNSQNYAEQMQFSVNHHLQVARTAATYVGAHASCLTLDNFGQVAHQHSGPSQH